MDIGFVANGAPAEVLERAARLGFDGVELCFDPRGPCDLERWTSDDTKRLQETMAATGARVLTVGSFWYQHLSPDKPTRERAARAMARAIELAPQLGTHVVTCMAFGDPNVQPRDQVKLFGEVFREYARRAEDHGVRIGIENYPAVRREHGLMITNLGSTPELFEMMFDAVPSKAVGMEYDPSHYYWQGADYVGVIRRFAERMVYMHAKDTQVFKDKLGRVGIYGDGWWTYRLPGLGEVDWDGVTRALAEIGYQTGIVIEHEDPLFQGARFEEGLSIGLKFLRQALRS